MCGNLSIFMGDKALARYGYYLGQNPMIKAIEYYLALAFLVHAIGGCYLTYRHKKWRSLASSRLFLSSLVLVAFLLVHLKTFKFTEKDYTINIQGLVLNLK